MKCEWFGYDLNSQGLMTFEYFSNLQTFMPLESYQFKQTDRLVFEIDDTEGRCYLSVNSQQKHVLFEHKSLKKTKFYPMIYIEKKDDSLSFMTESFEKPDLSSNMETQKALQEKDEMIKKLQEKVE